MLDDFSSEYLTFHRDQPPQRKTPIVYVRSKRHGDILGTIAWRGAWRQFCFWPEPHTVFNNGCMTDIQNVIRTLMDERKASDGSAKA